MRLTISGSANELAKFMRLAEDTGCAVEKVERATNNTGRRVKYIPCQVVTDEDFKRSWKRWDRREVLVGAARCYAADKGRLLEGIWSALADALRISRKELEMYASWSEIENTPRPSVELMRRIANELGLPMEQVVNAYYTDDL